MRMHVGARHGGGGMTGVGVLILISALAGCGTQDAEVTFGPPSGLAETWLLDAEPEEAVSVLEFREQLLASSGVAAPADESTEADADNEGDAADDAESTAAVAVSTEEQPVTLLARIGGKPKAGNHLEADVFPFEPGKASFVVCDPSYDPDAEVGGHDHGDGDHDDCPFCKAANNEAAQAHAIVRFVGDDGHTVPFSTQELFGVNEGEIVVIRGEGKLTVGTLMIRAEKIYVRR